MGSPASSALVRAVLVAVAVALLAAPAMADFHHLIQRPDRIQPGDPYNGICTLAFAFDGADGEVYISTAAHCIREIGESASTTNHKDFGVVVWAGDPEASSTDVALIRVHAGFRDKVAGDVLGHPGTPTGFTVPAETRIGDLVWHSGFGTGAGAVFLTREKRAGVLTFDSEQIYREESPTLWGDSGGPVVHGPTGKALGYVSRIVIGTGVYDEGPTVQRTLALAAAAGYDLTLRTASAS